jgi:multisubunit Na+/H+ antiporter MnhB subunit
MYAIAGIVVLVVTIGVFAVLKGRHPKEKNGRFLLWLEAERIASLGLAVALFCILLFVTLRYS